jgi:hypothetical protein
LLFAQSGTLLSPKLALAHRPTQEREQPARLHLLESRALVRWLCGSICASGLEVT